MIKLADILREVTEGAKVDFNDKNEPTAIAISQKPLDGEQLQTVSGKRSTDNFNVYYSLESDPKATNIKNAQDALKYHPEKINHDDLKALISSTIKAAIPKVDYIGFLESKGGLNKLLIEVIKTIYPEATIVPIAKMEYTEIDDAVDWEQFRKESQGIQKAIIDFLYKTAEKEPTYKIRKSGEVQSKIIQRLHSKYDLGLNPNVKNKKLPPIYDVFVKCISQGKKLLLVDDNLHTGTDFLKIFRAVDELKDKMIEEVTVYDGKEDKKEHQRRIALLTANYAKVRQNIAGYVLYKLKDSDLKA